jgi:D-3-phosphoglycerate dehydrogenase
MDNVFYNADFISLHIPGMSKPVIGEKEFSKMKKGVGIINCARGGVIDEKALFDALQNGRVGFAGLDVFEKEPPVYTDILKLKNVSLSPHIGASTNEAQERVGIEMATKIIEALKN